MSLVNTCLYYYYYMINVWSSHNILLSSKLSWEKKIGVFSLGIHEVILQLNFCVSFPGMEQAATGQSFFMFFTTLPLCCFPAYKLQCYLPQSFLQFQNFLGGTISELHLCNKHIGILVCCQLRNILDHRSVKFSLILPCGIVMSSILNWLGLLRPLLLPVEKSNSEND